MRTLTSMIKTYSELSRFLTFKDRYFYLRLQGRVGEATFGFDRYLNQILYSSRTWKRTRDLVIIRDNGCDLGLLDYPIIDKIIIHHMNPITVDDVRSGNEQVFNPEYLICTTELTHQAIHYGDESLIPKDPIIRKSGDTIPWR